MIRNLMIISILKIKINNKNNKINKTIIKIAFTLKLILLR